MAMTATKVFLSVLQVTNPKYGVYKDTF